jgi:uncharacterized protein
MAYQHDPAGRRLPVKLDTTTNGEFAPIPLEPVHRQARHLARERAACGSRRLGLSRRGFLVSTCGAASTLLAMNAAYAAAGRNGGFFDIPMDAAEDLTLAEATVGGDEFIFDVQGHFVNPEGAWLRTLAEGARPLSFAPKAQCPLADGPEELSYLECLGADEFVKDVFLDSDTDLMVLSFVPSTREGEPLTIEEAAATAGIVERLEGTHRLYLHGRVNPNQAGDLEDMERLAADYPIAAWKTYTQWGPEGRGFWLDDEVGLAFIEQARALGVRNIAIHKGIPFGRRSYEHSTCADIGRVARRFPDVNFLVYHSGFVPGQTEGPYDPARSDGVDALVTSVLDNGLGHGSNVYAELGSTWRFLMRDPDSAAHTLGKLLKHLGEDNVLWGTDSIWYGSPQDQIQAFRTFRISDELRERHDYPQLTPEARAKVFGRNALKVYAVEPALLDRLLPGDAISRQRENYRERRDPSFATHGPKTRREFMNLLRWNGGKVA